MSLAPGGSFKSPATILPIYLSAVARINFVVLRSQVSIVRLMQRVDQRKLKRLNSKKYDTTLLLTKLSGADLSSAQAGNKLFA